MSKKIYELYGSDQRIIDNLKRKIRGYEKMKKDITSQNRKVNNQNRKLQQENKIYKEVIDKINVLLNNHDKNTGKLYYKYNNKYLLSEIKEDIRDILKEVEDK